VASAVAADGFDPALVEHCISVFCTAGDPCALRAPAVALDRAQRLLRDQPRWRASEFTAAWAAACPEGCAPDAAWLAGEALEEGEWLVAFPAAGLPKQPRARFAALFAQRQRWSRAALLPYLEGVEEVGATAEGLLLAHCRLSQPVKDGPAWYSARF